MDALLHMEIQRQPNDVTCGPTCLHAVYRYFEDEIALDQVLEEVPQLESGGTLAVLMAIHALHRGYRAKMYTYDLHMFDPTWFQKNGPTLRRRLIQQARVKQDAKLHSATRAYLEYLDLGGELYYEDLSPTLLHRYLNMKLPILTGLSATYLYRTSRERGWDDEHDDIRGVSAGHFVVLCGYDTKRHSVLVADPLRRVPASVERMYTVGVHRLIGAILLGVLSYDGNLLILEKGGDREGRA